MPLEGLPLVRTLAEMYELARKHRLAPMAKLRRSRPAIQNENVNDFETSGHGI